MTEKTIYEVRDNVAVITLNSPPVNSLGEGMRAALLDNFTRACADTDVDAIVICAMGRLFCAGADIAEFANDQSYYAGPFLPDLLRTLEESTKPIVAAINGAALGGGLELALACDYRMALPQAQLGLPEVHLGILPGAGGTQRLPRLAGAELALEMIVTGKPIGARKALEAGIVDRIHEGDQNLTDSAVDYAKELVDSDAPVRSCVELSVDTSELPENFFDDFRKRIARRTRGFFAPERCIQCVEIACETPLNEGLVKEAELFQDCMATSQARAQQHLFFAERAATHVPGVDSKTPARPIEKVAVIGSGTMGGGIAMNFVNAGMEVIILDMNEEALQKGLDVIRKNYEISAQKGKFTAEQVEQCLTLIKCTTEYAELSDIDLVVEAVFEDMDIKTKVFQKLDAVCKPGAILASNTSTLDVDKIAAVTKRPEDVVGLHFFSPANVMRLLEIVRGAKTADDVLLTAIRMARKIGKKPVVAGVCWGFIGNRVLEPYGREAGRLILEGASPAQVDRVLVDFGMAMGFPSMIDLAGIDVGYLTRQGNPEASYGRDSSYSAVADKLYRLGRYGQKTGRGFYLYQGRDKQADPEVSKIAEELAREHNVLQREISDQEILERTLFMLINEGAQVLDDGIAYRSSDIDTVYCNGYGFPAYRGGPMQYADEIGLDTVLDVIEKYRAALGDYGEEWFKPAPLLKALVAEGRKFKDYQTGSES